MVQFLKHILAHPLTRGHDLDAAATTELHKKIIAEKIFLRRIYEEWHEKMLQSLPPGAGPVVEIGSGAGFLRERLPHLITSEILEISGVDLRFDACHGLPFKNQSLRAIVMIDVMHHMPNIPEFFREAQRCLMPGGIIAMIEPWVTSWSKFVYQRFHHEPCDPTSPDWPFPSSGPLSGANQALPWIVFHRDRAHFEREFPRFSIAKLEPFMPFRYLISGGVSLRSLVPGCFFPFFRALEKLLRPFNNRLAMFVHLVLKRDHTSAHE